MLLFHTPVLWEQAPASWREALNTDTTADVSSGNAQLRLRVVLRETNGLASTAVVFKWRYSKNGAAYTDVTASSANVRTFATTWYLDGDDVPQGLSSGAYLLDANSAEAGAGGFTLSPAAFPASTSLEAEIALECVAADLAHGDTLDFRLTQSDGTVLQAYTVTPRVTIVKTVSGGIAHLLGAMEGGMLRLTGGLVQ